MIKLEPGIGVSLISRERIDTGKDHIIDTEARRRLVGIVGREPGAPLVLRKQVSSSLLKEALRLLDERDGAEYPDRTIVNRPT